ncbi:uncharacterized protein EAF02_000836 [Botrytis sinoallii]|uniref:uncharacterized protein n=1 Tax=Botrytis sinoallii TaxID=1463999 RepID=UPI001901B49D|nr:uncharacterized protein EAF02_000836 [Botrytis sinoallii]KAF7893298.1 hypothetical protein EAF02_000836 [Botrytis sinoallii]
MQVRIYCIQKGSRETQYGNVTAKELRTKFPETAERRLRELTLLHHYTTNTSRTVTFTNSANPDQTAIDIFTQIVPEIALTNEALLYSIYCISSLHLNNQAPSSSTKPPTPTPNTSLVDAYTYSTQLSNSTATTSTTSPPKTPTPSVSPPAISASAPSPCFKPVLYPPILLPPTG